MLAKKVLSIGKSVIKAKLFRKGTPLVVSWRITHRCNYQCRYCGLQNVKDGEFELPTHQVLNIIHQLAKAGTQRITFTGGEPLLREDIGRILEYCKSKNMATSINTNGSFVKKLSTCIDCLNSINLSLDGPEEINDFIRGKGSFRDVMCAVEFAKKNNIATELTTVISKVNINSIGYLLDLAKKLDVIMTFQPATRNILGKNEKNSIAPSVQDYRRVVSLLMKEKEANNKNIGNSITGLKHLYSYPVPMALFCAMGRICCRINIKGEIRYCGRFPSKEGYNILNLGVDEAWSRLRPFVCNMGCWCAKLAEMSYLLSLNREVIKNTLSLWWREHSFYRGRKGSY